MGPREGRVRSRPTAVGWGLQKQATERTSVKSLFLSTLLYMRGLTSLVKLLLREAYSRRGTSNDASAMLALSCVNSTLSSPALLVDSLHRHATTRLTEFTGLSEQRYFWGNITPHPTSRWPDRRRKRRRGPERKQATYTTPSFSRRMCFFCYAEASLAEVSTKNNQPPCCNFCTQQ